jgi:hypothetical protein
MDYSALASELNQTIDGEGTGDATFGEPECQTLVESLGDAVNSRLSRMFRLLWLKSQEG